MILAFCSKLTEQILKIKNYNLILSTIPLHVYNIYLDFMPIKKIKLTLIIRQIHYATKPEFVIIICYYIITCTNKSINQYKTKI